MCAFMPASANWIGATPRASACLEERRPRPRRPLRPENVRPERAKVEIREDDVEPAGEARVGERLGPHAPVDVLCDGAVEAA